MKKNKYRFHCFRFVFWETELLVSSPTPPNPPLVLNTAQDLDSCTLGPVYMEMGDPR